MGRLEFARQPREGRPPHEERGVRVHAFPHHRGARRSRSRTRPRGAGRIIQPDEDGPPSVLVVAARRPPAADGPGTIHRRSRPAAHAATTSQRRRLSSYGPAARIVCAVSCPRAGAASTVPISGPASSASPEKNMAPPSGFLSTDCASLPPADRSRRDAIPANAVQR